MNAAELQEAYRRADEAEKYAMQCAIEIGTRLKWDPEAVLRFRGDLEQIIALWKMKGQARTPAPPTPVFPFRVLKGGAR